MDGRPFCPECRAPQIHVQMADGSLGESVPVAADGMETPDIAGVRAADFHVHQLQGGISNQRAAVKAALWAGALGSFIGMIPVLGIVLTGMLAVYLYRRETRVSPPPAMGARLGAAAGIVLFAINALFIIPIIVMHAQQECIDALVQLCQKFGIDTASPQFQASIGELFTPAGLAKSFIVALVLTAVGGALCALVMRRPPRN
ncbi:MAG: hypothetical protein WCB53_20935 [Terriglobales bacterium]